MKSRKRTAKHLPDHINPENIPKGVWFDKGGKGRWMLKFKDQSINKWRSRRLCSASCSIAEIWAAYEAENKPVFETFRTLSEAFQKTLTWRKLSPLTKNDYIGCHKEICKKQTTNGPLGDINIKNWTTGTVRKYRDSRGDHSESRANKELSYIKRIFSWAYEYEKVTTNPSLGIKKLTITPRQHYAEDKDYQFLLQTAKESNYNYLPPMMEIAYLCRMRLSEVIDITDSDILDKGLLVRRKKGSKNNIVEWSERLLKAVNTAKATRKQALNKKRQPLPIAPERRHLFISERTGDKLTVSGVKTAKSKTDKAAQEKAKILGIQYNHFWFHDLKRKGITDTSGDKLKASGHRSSNMLNIYDVGVETVKPADEK